MPFNPNEPRDPAGKWTKVKTVLDKIENLEPGKGFKYQGHDIYHVPKTGQIKIRLKGKGKAQYYKDAKEATDVAISGEHSANGNDGGRGEDFP